MPRFPTFNQSNAATPVAPAQYGQFGEFGKLPSFDKVKFDAPQSGAPNKKDGVNSGGGSLADFVRRFTDQANRTQGNLNSNASTAVQLNSFTDPTSITPEGVPAPEDTDIQSNTGNENNEDQGNQDNKNQQAATSNFDPMQVYGNLWNIMSVTEMPFGQPGGPQTQGFRDLLLHLGGQPVAEQDINPNAGKRARSDEQNQKTADIYTTALDDDVSFVDGKPVIREDFNMDNYYNDLQDYFSRTNSGYKDNPYNFVVNGTPEEWRAMLADPTMAQYYADAYNQYGDIGHNDDAFNAYWGYYKPMTVDEITDPNNDAYWATGMTDKNLIQTMNRQLYDAGENSIRIPEGLSQEQNNQLISLLSDGTERVNPERIGQIADYVTLQNILSKAEPGSLGGLSRDELNDLAYLDPSYFGTAEDAGGAQPEIRENWQGYTPTKEINIDALLGNIVPNTYLPGMNLADQVSHVMPGYGIISQKESKED